VPLSDLPMDKLFLFFLVLFVVITLYPAWAKTAGRIRRFYQEHAGRAAGPVVPGGAEATTFETWQQGVRLSDLEFFLLWRLAMAGRGGLSRRQLQDDLHLAPAVVRANLASLQERDLVRVTALRGLTFRYGLSEKGRQFAVQEGYLPDIRRG
jgi:hypothetical protein